jgi:hypothetical protein
MGVYTTCWISLAQSQHTILQLDLAFLFVFGVFVFEKVNKALRRMGYCFCMEQVSALGLS